MRNAEGNVGHRKAASLGSTLLGLLCRDVLLGSLYQQYRLVVPLVPELNRLIHEPRYDLSQWFRGVI